MSAPPTLLIPRRAPRRLRSPSVGPRRARAARLLALLALLILGAARTAATPSPEQIRAAFLLNFAEFTTWPGDSLAPAPAPLIIAVTDPASFREIRDSLRDHTVQGRDIVVVPWARPELPPARFHVAYIHAPDVDRAAAWLQACLGRPILTVGEAPGFARNGGIINLSPRGTRLGFDVNPANASRAGLVLSSRLLRLGTIIEADAPLAAGETPP